MQLVFVNTKKVSVLQWAAVAAAQKPPIQATVLPQSALWLSRRARTPSPLVSMTGWRSSDCAEDEMTTWGRKSAMLSITWDWCAFKLGNMNRCEGRPLGQQK